MKSQHKIYAESDSGYYGTCDHCGGSGQVDVECNACAGTGKRFDGEKCPHCRGLGQKSVTCIVCRGKGTIWKTK